MTSIFVVAAGAAVVVLLLLVFPVATDQNQNERNHKNQRTPKKKIEKPLEQPVSQLTFPAAEKFSSSS